MEKQPFILYCGTLIAHEIMHHKLGGGGCLCTQSFSGVKALTLLGLVVITGKNGELLWKNTSLRKSSLMSEGRSSMDGTADLNVCSLT